MNDPTSSVIVPRFCKFSFKVYGGSKQYTEEISTLNISKQDKIAADDKRAAIVLPLQLTECRRGSDYSRRHLLMLKTSVVKIQTLVLWVRLVSFVTCFTGLGQ